MGVLAAESPDEERLGPTARTVDKLSLGKGYRPLRSHQFSASANHPRAERGQVEAQELPQNILRLPEPVIMAERSTPGEPLPVKFKTLAQGDHGAIALVTPDDVGGVAQLTGDVSQLERRARQNVWLEVGGFGAVSVAAGSSCSAAKKR